MMMVPGHLSVISHLLTPRRYLDPSYLARIAPEIYGGEYRNNPEFAHSHAYERQLTQPSLLNQFLAGEEARNRQSC